MLPVKDRAFDIWWDLVCNSSRAECERDLESYLIFHKGMISLIRELGIDEEICSHLWDSIVIVADDFFNSLES